MELQLSPGNVKNAMKSVGASSSDLWKVPPQSIVVLPGYNIRIKNARYRERVEAIKESILVNGFLPDHPRSGYVNRTGDGDEVVLIGGHRRLEATLLAIKEGAEIDTVPVIIKPKGTDMGDLFVDLKVGNDGEPLSMLEQALLCKRLITFGWNAVQVAERFGYKTSQTVDNYLVLAGAGDAIHNYISEERISASLAIQLLTKHGVKAYVMIEKMMGDKTSKVTPKDVPAIRFKQQLRKQAEPMYETLKTVQADPAFGHLAPETQEALKKLLTTAQG